MRKIIPILFTIVPLFLSAVWSVVHADWQQDGNPICFSDGDQWYGYIASDGTGGVIIAWYEVRLEYNSDIFAQRIDADGTIQWNLQGVPICEAIDVQLDPFILPDGENGAVIAWRDQRSGYYDIYAQRIDAGGHVQWATDGVAVCTADFGQYAPLMTTDGAGGYFICWCDDRTGNRQVRYNKLNADGTLAWGADGIIARDTPWWQQNRSIVPDGAGGAIIVWDDVNNGFTYLYIFAQRIDHNGTKLWDPDGVLVHPSGGMDQQNPLVSTPSGDGGVIIAWACWTYIDEYWDIYVQKVDADGSVAWTPFGSRICNATGEQKGPRIVSDGEGGAIVTWLDKRHGRDDIYAQRVGPDGAALWAEDGIPIRIGPSSTGFDWTFHMIPDGAGGAIVTWQEGLGTPTSWDIFAQRVDASGNLLWPDTSVSVCRAPEGQYFPQPATDGANGAIITWRDMRQDTIGAVYAMRIRADGHTVPTLLKSYHASVIGQEVVIEWTLSAVEPDVQFFVLRAPAGSEYEKLAGMEIQRDGFRFTCIDDTCEPGGMYRYRVDIETDGARRTLLETEIVTIVPSALTLHQNYPNPFNPATTIPFMLPERMHVKLMVYDVEGKPVAKILDAKLDAGLYKIIWNGCNAAGRAVSSGIYFYRLQAGRRILTRKMVLLK